MNRLFAAVFALLLSGGVALADQIEGTVQSVDVNANTVVINGQPYMFEQGVKPKVSDIKVGDKLRLQFDVNTRNVYEAVPAK